MISAFDVYLVMQLDSIRSTLSFITIVGIIVACASLLFSPVISMAAEDSDSFRTFLKRLPIKTLVGVWVASLTIGTVLPSTKTMAAMIVLPALTSDEVIDPAKKEAAELYDLAKQALRQAVEDRPKKSSEE